MPGTQAPGDSGSWSLQRHLRRRLLLLLVLAWALGSAVALRVLWRETEDVLDAGLNETAEHLLILPDAAMDDHDRAERRIQSLPHNPYLVYQVFDSDGRLRVRSRNAPLQPLDPGAPDGARTGARWHVVTLTTADGQHRAQVGEAVEHRREVLWRSLGALVAGLLALLPVAAWGLGWVLRRGFETLEPARRELARRSLDGHAPRDLEPVASHRAPAELRPWLNTVNALLARVRALVEREREFAASTAHELRTPLAAARAQAQRLLASGDAGEHRASTEALVRQLDRLTHLATRMLQLARIDAGVALERQPVDLVTLALLVADDFAEAQRNGRLHIAVDRRPAPVQGDIDALGIALRNLIDNALKHGGDAATVTVRIDGQRLAVEDDGPGAAPEQLGDLVRPFERGAHGVVAGSGLGLAMVERIARQSGARLSLRSPRDDGAEGRGFVATLDFELVD